MIRTRAAVIASLAVLLPACDATSHTSDPTAARPSGAVSLSTSPVAGLGTVVVNLQGRTLYTFARDKAKKVTCTGRCAQLWRPLKLTAKQEPSMSGGVEASLVSSDPDPAGGRVVTYAGWPLYVYAADQAAGSLHGQALTSSGGAWYAISPSGTVIRTRVERNDTIY